MRLSRLHINGFKSFPDRAELSFDDGVTAIVGPNGCGKSNVVDAITWVLGEQSAKSLRGERMEDIIFNGSDARKPTQSAEVRLRLANVAQVGMTVPVEPGLEIVDLDPAVPPAEGENGQLPLVTRDVEIGRRLYRSGESEYLIDGEVCRLRDVHDLLMDSGLGVKAYAVIEQGKIGQILSSRPAERRSLIEEAAGVTKYKARRRSAELKLEAAQQNLTRVDDIIFEVEKQRGALKRQAAKARRYKRLREELRRWDQVQFAKRHESLARDIASADTRLEEARVREAAAAAHVAELETALETLRIQLTEAERAATETREQAHQRELGIGRHQQQVAFDKQQVQELGQRLEQLTTEATDLDARLVPAREAIAAQREAISKATATLTEAQDRVAACEEEYQRAQTAVQGVEHDADQTRAAVMASATTLSALRQARDNAAAARDRVAQERTRFEVELRDLQQESERATRDREEVTAALARAREVVAEAITDRAAAEAALVAARSERERLSRQLSQTHRDLAGLEARLRSLEDIERKRSTFGDAARFLLAEAPETVGQHGAFADYVQVEPSFERAVDALLGDLLQHVVVDRPAQVHQALARLNERQAGRCGFLVLDDTRSTAPRTVVETPAGARALRDVARATGPYADLVARVLPDAWIAESFEAARALAAQFNVPVSTRAGEVFHGAGLVEGGVSGGSHGILETRAEAQTLRAQVTETEKQAHQLATDVTSIDFAILNGESDVTAKRAAQHDQEKAIVGFEARVSRAADEVTRVARRIELVSTERRRSEEEEAAAERRRDEALLAIVAHESGQLEAEQSLGAVLARLQSARGDAETQMRRVSDARAEQMAVAERVSSLQAEGRRLEESLADVEARLSARRAEMTRAEARREELGQSIVDTERKLDDDVRALNELRESLRGLDETVNEVRAQFGARETEIRSARHALETVRSAVMQSEVARATAHADLTHLAAACLEAVNATIDEVVAEVARMEAAGELAAPGRRLAAASAAEPDDDDETPAEASLDAQADAQTEGESDASADDAGEELSPEAVIASLRQKIERLGPVNMMAIDQFDELETRHTFLTTQRKDLLDSISQTAEAIKRIDVITRERFAEAFAQINANFEVTFTTLFGGGKAGLVLIDQENQVESGIDIIAQPPGKRLQNVQLLSGGEKAMTAMALMFAIFKFRPSPFCLLDEIDAPLDDANIGRFVEMLQGMQSHTQFILITHNRKTMEIADRLYGVTMEEPGVSKLISVQMN
ncbi:MAG: chromosome segregation protein SMC [Acidimicrobiia bacterium]|nr:chromosome segregation protein SMC [Acidimicrobiia bacterium]